MALLTMRCSIASPFSIPSACMIFFTRSEAKDSHQVVFQRQIETGRPRIPWRPERPRNWLSIGGTSCRSGTNDADHPLRARHRAGPPLLLARFRFVQAWGFRASPLQLPSSRPARYPFPDLPCWWRDCHRTCPSGLSDDMSFAFVLFLALSTLCGIFSFFSRLTEFQRTR